MNSETHQSLLKRVRERRRSIHAFVKNLEPKGVMLTNINIVCSAIATILTAGPAIGGKTLMDALGASGPNTFSWRIVFALAALLSLASAIAANLYKSQDMAANLNKARACDAKLEGLETLIDLDKIDLDDAAKQYTQFLPDISFISDNATMFRDRSVLDWVKGKINQPHLSEVVDDVIPCSGWVEGLGSNLHLWLAVEVKNCYWPKEGEIVPDEDGSWSKVVYEDGETETFALSLLVADKKAHKRIRAWLDKCDETGDYMHLQGRRGLRRLDRIDGLHRGKGVKDNVVIQPASEKPMDLTVH